MYKVSDVQSVMADPNVVMLAKDDVGRFVGHQQCNPIALAISMHQSVALGYSNGLTWAELRQVFGEFVSLSEKAVTRNNAEKVAATNRKLDSEKVNGENRENEIHQIDDYDI